MSDPGRALGESVAGHGLQVIGLFATDRMNDRCASMISAAKFRTHVRRALARMGARPTETQGLAPGAGSSILVAAKSIARSQLSVFGLRSPGP